MRNFRDLYEDSVEEKQSPSQMMQQRRKMARRMKLLAKKSSTKIKKKTLVYLPNFFSCVFCFCPGHLRCNLGTDERKRF